MTIGREITLNFTPKKKQRRIWILPYEEEWKDDVPIHTEHFLCKEKMSICTLSVITDKWVGCLTADLLLGFLEEVNSVQRKVSDPLSPSVVICGTGGGRSGVFVLSDLLLRAADSGHVR